MLPFLFLPWLPTWTGPGHSWFNRVPAVVRNYQDNSIRADTQAVALTHSCPFPSSSRVYWLVFGGISSSCSSVAITDIKRRRRMKHRGITYSGHGIKAFIWLQVYLKIRRTPQAFVSQMNSRKLSLLYAFPLSERTRRGSLWPNLWKNIFMHCE